MIIYIIVIKTRVGRNHYGVYIHVSARYDGLIG